MKTLITIALIAAVIIPAIVFIFKKDKKEIPTLKNNDFEPGKGKQRHNDILEK